MKVKSLNLMNESSHGSIIDRKMHSVVNALEQVTNRKCKYTLSHGGYLEGNGVGVSFHPTVNGDQVLLIVDVMYDRSIEAELEELAGISFALDKHNGMRIGDIEKMDDGSDYFRYKILLGPAAVREGSVNSYGKCPECGGYAFIRERRMDGDTICENQHRTPSKQFDEYNNR